MGSREVSDRVAVSHRGAVAAVARFRDEMVVAGAALGKYRDCDLTVKELSSVYGRAILSLSIATRSMVLLESELTAAIRESAMVEVDDG